MKELLLSHWHCIVPAVVIFAALFLMRDKKNDKIETKPYEEK